MRLINIHEAKTHLSKLVDAAAAGEEIVIARAGKPVALLSSLPAEKQRRAGVLKGRIRISADFDAPLSGEMLADFEGGS